MRVIIREPDGKETTVDALYVGISGGPIDVQHGWSEERGMYCDIIVDRRDVVIHEV